MIILWRYLQLYVAIANLGPTHIVYKRLVAWTAQSLKAKPKVQKINKPLDQSQTQRRLTGQTNVAISTTICLAPE
jgi:hypothetical protein